MDIPIFEISIKKYSITNWDVKKNILLNSLPKDKYTDFYENRNNPNLPEYFDTVTYVIHEELEEFSMECDFPIIVTSAWYEKSRMHDYHPVHTHGCTGYAAILYVDFNPQYHESTKFYSPFSNPITGDMMEYQPEVKEGDLIIFPSFLLHEGPMNTSNIPRVIVSFNMMGVDAINAYHFGVHRGIPLT